MKPANESRLMRAAERVPLYHWKGKETALEPLRATSFADQKIMERADLQRVLRDRPDVLEVGLIIIAEEAGHWDDAKRRIDLLAIDRDHKLVVIELKRTDDGGLEDLQAVRYAAMSANMTFDDAVLEHRRYMSTTGSGADAAPVITEEQARGHLIALLGADGDEPQLDSSKPRILLVSSGFSKELTTTVLWLNGLGLDIKCIRVKPYELGDQHIVLNVEDLIPLPEESAYVNQWRKKTVENERSVIASKRERVIQILRRTGRISPGDQLVFNRQMLPAGTEVDLTARRFRARFGDHLDVQKNVIWEDDETAYALSPLTAKLRDTYALAIHAGSLNGNLYWCLESNQTESLVDLAKKLAGSGDGGQTSLPSALASADDVGSP